MNRHSAQDLLSLPKVVSMVSSRAKYPQQHFISASLFIAQAQRSIMLLVSCIASWGEVGRHRSRGNRAVSSQGGHMGASPRSASQAPELPVGRIGSRKDFVGWDCRAAATEMGGESVQLNSKDPQARFCRGVCPYK